MSTIKADLSRCRGYANCVMAAPDYFDLELSGEVRILRSTIADADIPMVTEAARACPVSALTIE